ncbi:MAG: phosphate/phosphite/phosphonate ABC transporter substrate-binding protein [Acidimicrobiia bacterium]|nr:phosphate/phosphite/phosphonate ABC transporter substrate-binding protein [Acidimicrobiia bacterium]
MATGLGFLLSFTAWLAPGLPLAMFDAIASAVSIEIGVDYTLTVEPKISGPTQHVDDLFARGVTDVGFLCPPSYVWLRQPSVTSVVLAPLAPVFDDIRDQGRPVYFSDLVVTTDSPYRRFTDLAGARVGYNDRSSLSGYFSLLHHLDEKGLDPGFFGGFDHVGSHVGALELITAGDLDAAAVDANVLRTWRTDNPGRADRVRSIADIGPHPVQPIVLRAAAAGRLLPPLVRALSHEATLESVARCGITVSPRSTTGTSTSSNP